MGESPDLCGLLDLAVASGASDLHVGAGAPIMGRIHGDLVPLSDTVLGEETVTAILDASLTAAQRETLGSRRSLDAAMSHAGHRFRINVYGAGGGHALAVRRLESIIPTLASLNMPPETLAFTDYPHGLVIFTGATGSGKSSSLAAIIDHINGRDPVHILTIEDPVEYVHKSRRALVHQREVGPDVSGFAESLREALREDPDVILVGEMRDLPTARAALTAAETGHLVFSTLHSGDAAGALDRLMSLYPSNEHESVRRQLASTLRGVVAQTLLPRADGTGRTPAVEILRCTGAVQNLIRTGQFNQIASAIETGRVSGMRSFDQSLAELVHLRIVAPHVALAMVRNRRLHDDYLVHLRQTRAGRPEPLKLSGSHA